MEIDSAHSDSLEFQGGGRVNPAKALGKIFVIDHLVALNKIDLLENCEILSNLVVCDTLLKFLNRKNIQSFHALRNTLEQIGRNFYYLYNENFAETLVDEEDPETKKELRGRGLDFKLQLKVLKAFQFYSEHLRGLTEGEKVYLLTES